MQKCYFALANVKLIANENLLNNFFHENINIIRIKFYKPICNLIYEGIKNITYEWTQFISVDIDMQLVHKLILEEFRLPLWHTGLYIINLFELYFSIHSVDIPGTPWALEPGAGFCARDFLKLSAIVCVRWSDKPAPTTSTSICNVSRAPLANTWSIELEVERVILVDEFGNYF